MAQSENGLQVLKLVARNELEAINRRLTLISRGISPTDPSVVQFGTDGLIIAYHSFVTNSCALLANIVERADTFDTLCSAIDTANQCKIMLRSLSGAIT
jgi:hypothetical protein